MGNGHRSPHLLREYHSLQIFMCSPTHKHLEPCILVCYGGFITQARLNKSSATMIEFNIQTLSSLENGGQGLELNI